MNPSNPLYEYADKLNEYGVKLVKKFMNSKQYSDLCSKVHGIDKEIERLNREHEIKLLNLKKEKLNIQLYEIPKAKDEYVRQHIEGYKMHLKIQQTGDNSFETYMKELNNESVTR